MLAEFDHFAGAQFAGGRPRGSAFSGFRGRQDARLGRGIGCRRVQLRLGKLRLDRIERGRRAGLTDRAKAAIDAGQGFRFLCAVIRPSDHLPA